MQATCRVLLSQGLHSSWPHADRFRFVPALVAPVALLVQMRSVYGKLVYIIQDSVNPAISELMGFHLYR